MAHRIPADLPRLARHHCRKSGRVQQRQVCAFEREQSHKRRLWFGQRPARATTSGRQAVLLMAAQMTATSALQQASDHKTGYVDCKQRLETLIHTVHALPKH